MKITLRPVTLSDAQFLYEMLKERTPEMSINHREMPTFEKHVTFMESNPYPVWYMIECGHHTPVGHVYLTKGDEIGIFVKQAFKGMGIGTKAVEDIMRLHKRDRYVANIAPKNEISQGLFLKLGFKRIQLTYEKLPVSSGVSA